MRQSGETATRGEAMRIRYDPEVDVLYLEFRNERVWDSDEVSEGIILHFDKLGGVVGLEILDAKKRGFLEAVEVEVGAPRVSVRLREAGGG